MTHAQREKYIKDNLLICEKIRTTKGAEYSNSTADANLNFHSDSEIGISPVQSLGVFMNKHYRSIRSWMRHGKVFSEEEIEGRIHDMINYLLILLTLIEDKRQK